MTASAKSRTIQVLRFLREFDQIRNKPLRHVRQHLDHLYRRDFPVGPGCRLHVTEIGVEEEDTADGGTLRDSPLLTVEKQRLTRLPAPPDVLEEWLEVDGRDPEKPPVARATRAPVRGEPLRSEPERFEDSRERVEAFERWLEDAWRPWAQREGPRRKVQALYEHLYDLYLQLRRDTEEIELVWASGLLAWRLDGEEILHPLVLAPVSLLFDRDAGRLQVVPTSAVPELADDIFQGLTSRSFVEFDSLAREFRASPIAPWDGVEVGPLLGRIANVLSTRGTVVDGASPPGSDPVISRDDLLLLRKRRAGYGRDIERWLQIFEGDVEPPATVRQVVGVHGQGSGTGGAVWLDAESLLFPLPANQEQEEIARRLTHHPGVVVQGPPGTGKSHTIANLVSHLLAHGKTILITAQTERALRVLRDKVPESIRSLCVSVTGNDVDAQEELKRSVRTVIERTGGSRDAHAQQAARARERLAQVRAAIAAHWGKVGEATRAETAEVTIAGQSWTPSRAAQYLREHEAQDGWLPDRIAPDTALPLTDAELAEFLGLLTHVVRDDVHAATRHLPNPGVLPDDSTFREHVEQADRLGTALAGASPLVSQWRLPAGPSFQDLLLQLAEVRQGFERALEDLATFRTPWIQSIRGEIARDPGRREAWQRLADELRHRRDQVLKDRAAIAHRSVEVAIQAPLGQRLTDVQALRAHVAAGGGFGLLFGVLYARLKRTRTACRVDGTEPSTIQDLDAILTALRIEQLRGELLNLVANEIEAVGGPSLGDSTPSPEHGADAIVHSLSRLLAWQDQTWEALRRQLWGLGCDLRPRGRSHAPPVPQPPSVTIEEAPDEIEAAQLVIDLLGGLDTKVALAAHDDWRDDLVRRLEAPAGDADASILWGRLAEAARREDARSWKQAMEESNRLNAIAPDARRLAELRDRLGGAAPQWTASLLDGAGESRALLAPQRAGAAWRWSQISHWFERYLASPAPEDLRRQIDTRKTFEAELVAQLVEHSTWAALHVGEAERQALAGWQQMIGRIGKGTGKRAPLLKRQAQEQMSAARRAVPVWIMPLARVIENFSPDGPRFDVVIVDESSQADTFGFLALLRADRAVVVGDDNQISPAAVGQRLDVVDQLITKHLGGIPNDKLYDGQQSLYDLATAAFGGVIRLREHFRCVPEIISFSNGFYANEIQPLRDPTDSALTPPVVLHRVNGFRAPGTDTNEPEADWVAALVAACCAHPAYKEATLGVISLLGEDQARAILDRVRRRVPPEELERRAFIAGDAYHFQGDERDVMFLSLVEAPAARRPAVLNRRTDQQRFNVAASRARDQMWLVHSIDAAEFHPEDMRARLLTHFGQADQRARNWRAVEEILRHDTHYFQRLVAKQIIDRGYRARAEVRVGQYRIDLVVDGESDSLAVECDGERWHTIDTHRDDVARQITLERLGWKFLRIRGGQYFRDPDGALTPLWRRLNDLGIQAANHRSSEVPEAPAAEILRRAEELLGQPDGDAATADTVSPELPVSPQPKPSPASPAEPNGPEGAASSILAFLIHNPSWHGRQAIVTATGTDDEWRGAIDALLERGLVLRRGAKRGTQYCAPPASAPPASRTVVPPTPPGAEPAASGTASAVAGSDDGGLESARRALIQLREESVRPAFPNTPPERGLLRRAMIDAFLTHRPTSAAEYERRMPESMRAYTDPAQLRYLPEVFVILARLPRP